MTEHQEDINFESINISIPETIKRFSPENQQEIFNYLKSMDDSHKKAYEIALDHLGSSYNIYRSNGFMEWKKNKKN